MAAIERIKAFDGLRAYAAFMVFLHHFYEMIVAEPNVIIKGILNPLTPILLFFTLSGFMMAFISERKTQSYKAFIVKRYFRLAPLLMILCVAYFAITPLIIAVLEVYLPQRIPVFESAVQNPLTHFGIKSTMLYGLFNVWVPHASSSLIPPAWSITVEWQFYLIAPLLIWVFHKRFAISAFIAVVLSLFAKELLGFNATMFIQYGFYFFAGIASYFLWFSQSADESLKAYAKRLLIVVLVVQVTISAVFLGPLFVAGLSIPYIVWFSVIGAMLKHARSGNDSNQTWLARIFENRAVQYIGKLSYAFYLLHMFGVYTALALLMPYQAEMPFALFFTLAFLLSFLITTVLSDLSYRFIEQPSIRWSSKLTKAW